MKIPGLPPELEAVMERVNERMVAGHGPDVVIDEELVMSDGADAEMICRALMLGDFEPDMVEGVLKAVDEAASAMHHMGHTMSCPSHTNSLRVTLIQVLMVGWFLRGEPGMVDGPEGS